MATSLRTLSTFTALAGLCAVGCNLGLEFEVMGFDSQGNPIFDTEETDADADADADSDGDTDADADADADTDGTITISDLDPYYGTTNGGQTVTINGGPFDSSASVRFGSNTASIQNFGTDTLVVSSPSATGEGSVDVVVSTDAGSGSAQDAFFYFEDGSGQAGIIGEIGWQTFLTDAWVDPTPYGYAWFSVIVPQNMHLWDSYGPSLENCENGSWSSGNKIYVYDIDTRTTTIRPTSGSSSTLTWNSTYLQWANMDLSSSQYQNGSTYSLDTIESSNFVPIDISPLARTPAAFSVTTPNFSGSSYPYVSRSSLQVRWSGSGGDAMLIGAQLYNADTTVIEQEVYCLANDDGSFTIPSTEWSGFPSDRVMVMSVRRIVESGGSVEFNDSQSRVVGSYTINGVAITQ